MFQLLQPIFLYAIAATAIPVFIHLWNIREGKTLQVGSILFLHESARQQARSLRLKDVWLLLLRCLLIITLACLVAKPTWQKRLTTSNEKGWILIERQSLAEAYDKFKPVIDSLTQLGYKFHYFNEGFKDDNLQDALKRPKEAELITNLSYRTLLKQLNEQVPSELPVYLFTTNQLKRFAGARLTVSINLKWSTYTSPDTATHLTVKAYKTSTDSIRTIVANSTPAATLYTSENVLANSANVKNGRLVVSSKDTVIDDIEIDTSTLHVTIYADQFAIDANYLKAAIDAIKQYTNLSLKTSLVHNVEDIKPNSNWIFWLSEKPFTLKTKACVFVYEKGKEQQINSWIAAGEGHSVNQKPVHLSRIIKSNDTSDKRYEVLWRDGFANELLSYEKINNSYHFFSRLNPNWNDLPWNPQFVEMIFDLLFKEDISTKDYDKRIIETSQIQPEFYKEGEGLNKQKFVEVVDLTKLFWLIAFILFCVERYISLTRNKREVYA